MATGFRANNFAKADESFEAVGIRDSGELADDLLVDLYPF